MGKLTLLDCTLRDGGYINDWRFGKEAIWDIRTRLDDTGVDILELGFLKNEPYQEDRTVFNDMEQVKALIGKKRPGTLYAIMCEVVNPLPLEMLAPADPDSADIIRVIVWKTRRNDKGETVDALEEGFAYCKGIVEKGYRLCVQPARVSQYSDAEFTAMVQKFSQLHPMAIYIVDSWGTMYQDKLLHYMHLADDVMPASVAVGYHGHNNMMQAFDVACAFAKESLHLQRDMIIDASVYGIGRGAGNLNLELFAKYTNDEYGRTFEISPMLCIYDRYIRMIYEHQRWGFSLANLIAAKYNINPNYALYYDLICHLPVSQIEAIMKQLPGDDAVMYTKGRADYYMEKILAQKGIDHHE